MKETGWINEFPTKPGVYWVRNYRISMYTEPPLEPEPTAVIVEICDDGDAFWPGNEIAFHRRNVASAEWFGPIQPPVETLKRGAVPCTRCAWCEKVTSQLVAWTAQADDGMYHGAVICRECFAAALPPEQCAFYFPNGTLKVTE